MVLLLIDRFAVQNRPQRSTRARKIELGKKHVSSSHLIDDSIEEIKKEPLHILKREHDEDGGDRGDGGGIGDDGGEREGRLRKGLGGSLSDAADANVALMGKMLPVRIRLGKRPNALDDLLGSSWLN